MRVSLSNNTALLDHDQYGRKLKPGFARVNVFGLSRNYARVNLRRVRDALDQITLEDESAEVEIAIRSGWASDLQPYPWNQRRGPRFLFRMAPSGKIRVTMPCGEVRDYQLRTLDRVLLAFGV